LNYPVNRIVVGNGQGFSTENPALGFPAGGLGPDNRIGLYLGDSWKVKPNLTLSVGVRYDRDTGRTDSDLAPIPELSTLFDNQFYSGLGNRVNNPNKNFAPQLGFQYDPWKTGRTVFRGGIGLFYENSIWNNVLFDRPARLPTGSFLAVQPSCAGGRLGQLPATERTSSMNKHKRLSARIAGTPRTMRSPSREAIRVLSTATWRTYCSPKQLLTRTLPMPIPSSRRSRIPRRMVGPRASP